MSIEAGLGGSDALPCAILATDGEGRLLNANATFLEWLGLVGKGLNGRLIDDLMPAEFRLFLHTHVWPMLLKNGQLDEVYLELRDANGQGQPMLLNVKREGEASHPGARYHWVLLRVRERRKFEAELILGRQRLENLVQSTGAGTWEWNVQTGDYRVNTRWAAILGWSLADLGPINEEFRRGIAHPDEIEHSDALLATCLGGQGGDYVDEVRLRRRDGDWAWVQLRGRVVSRDFEGRPLWMFGILIDIEARKQQEEALRRSQDLLTRTNELAGVGGWELDLRRQALYWSEQTCRIHGVPPDHRPSVEEAIEFYAPEARAQIQAAVEQGIERGEGWDLELPFVRRDGGERWVRALGCVQREGGEPVRLIGAIQDVTTRVEQQAELQRLASELADQHEMLRVTLQSIGDAVITTDLHGAVTWLNPVAERLTGWAQSEAQGEPLRRVFNIVHEVTRQPAPNPAEEALEKGRAVALAEQTLLLARTGTEYGIEDSAAPIIGNDGRVHGAVLVFRDVTEQRRLMGEIHYRASHDTLTELDNRSAFESRLRRVLERAQQGLGEHVLLAIDLDKFKLVNDACGHAAGDELLRQVARLMKRSVRNEDVVARLGGDEFAILLEYCSGDQGLRVARQICELVDAYRFVQGERRFRVGTSIGLVSINTQWGDVGELMKAADAACFSAKEAGRNRVHTWHAGDQGVQSHQGQTQWASRLEEALDAGRFELHAQLIVPLHASPSSGWHAEVLLRLIDTDGRLVLPGAFLPAAERFHLATRIDRWVLQRTLDLLGEATGNDAPSSLSVNLSGQSVGDRQFHTHALTALTAAGEATCRRLTLEITETAAITNMADASAFVAQVRSLGVRVALDDFGAGSSSFGYLKQLQVDVLKIDGQFVRGLLEDPLDDVAVRSFVEVARVLKLQTVAEFVDRPELSQRLMDLGVNFAQGYLVHRPESLQPMMVRSPV